ncbi:MAG: hypothetical protein IPH40_07215 [Polaromonas sp.]|nr:hypothetical protein [Polaromonas sp.]
MTIGRPQTQAMVQRILAKSTLFSRHRRHLRQRQRAANLGEKGRTQRTLRTFFDLDINPYGKPELVMETADLKRGIKANRINKR